MKSARVYLFKTETINFVNLLQFCFFLSREDIYQPCYPKILYKHLTVDPGGFALHFAPDNPCVNFRNIDWTTKLAEFDEVLAQTTDKIVLGCNDIEQVNLLKNHFGDNCYTISCSYSYDDYDSFLSYITNSHIVKQSTGQLKLTDHDIAIRNDKNINLFDYYKQSFDQQKILQNSMSYDTDYSVVLTDYFDKNKFFQHVTNIGGNNSIEAVNYYDSWYSMQNTFFMTTQNEIL